MKKRTNQSNKDELINPNESYWKSQITNL